MTRYHDGDFLSVSQIAEAFGFTDQYVAVLTGENNVHQDPELFRHRVETDETYRKAYDTKARYVYPYEAVKAWYQDRQQRSRVAGAFKRNHH